MFPYCDMHLSPNNIILKFQTQQSRQECLFHISRFQSTVSASSSLSFSLCWTVAKYDSSLWSKILSRRQAGWCGRNVLNFYWEDGQFEFWPGHWPSCVHNFTQSLQKNAQAVSRLRHDQFFPSVTLSISAQQTSSQYLFPCAFIIVNCGPVVGTSTVSFQIFSSLSLTSHSAIDARPSDTLTASFNKPKTTRQMRNEQNYVIKNESIHTCPIK